MIGEEIGFGLHSYCGARGELERSGLYMIPVSWHSLKLHNESKRKREYRRSNFYFYVLAILHLAPKQPLIGGWTSSNLTGVAK